MVDLINQIAGMTKEVAMTYIILYGLIEILKLGLTGFLAFHGIKAFVNVFLKLFEGL